MYLPPAVVGASATAVPRHEGLPHAVGGCFVALPRHGAGRLPLPGTAGLYHPGPGCSGHLVLLCPLPHVCTRLAQTGTVAVHTV